MKLFQRKVQTAIAKQYTFDFTNYHEGKKYYACFFKGITLNV